MEETKIKMLKALRCLYIAVDESIAKDVQDKVFGHVDALEAKLAEREAQLAKPMSADCAGADDQSPLELIREKCVQYWNEANIPSAEVHAILGWIHTQACRAESQRAELDAKLAERGRRHCGWTVGDGPCKRGDDLCDFCALHLEVSQLASKLDEREADLNELTIGPLPTFEREELQAKVRFLEEALDAARPHEPNPRCAVHDRGLRLRGCTCGGREMPEAKDQ